MYSIKELSFADNRRILRYKQQEIFGTKFNLKGFNYPWILSSRNWSADDHVLDVGAGYSRLPIYIADKYGCEVWSVDDFGMESGEAFWERHTDPNEHIVSNPQVKFVLERLGNPRESSLPANYFDCIYSASALEHVPEMEIENVWAHMDRLLRPGGEMIHGLDFRLPTGRGVFSLMKASLIDLLEPVMPRSLKLKYAYYIPSPYLRLAFRGLNGSVRGAIRGMGALTLALDPSIVLEPIDWAYNRLIKDGLEDIYPQRVASLLIHLRKDDREEIS